MGYMYIMCVEREREREKERERERERERCSCIRCKVHPIISLQDMTNMYCVSGIQLECTGYKYLTLQISPQLIQLTFQQHLPNYCQHANQSHQISCTFLLTKQLKCMHRLKPPFWHWHLAFTCIIYVGPHPKTCKQASQIFSPRINHSSFLNTHAAQKTSLC